MALTCSRLLEWMAKDKQTIAKCLLSLIINGSLCHSALRHAATMPPVSLERLRSTYSVEEQAIARLV